MPLPVSTSGCGEGVNPAGAVVLPADDCTSGLLASEPQAKSGASASKPRAFSWSIAAGLLVVTFVVAAMAGGVAVFVLSGMCGGSKTKGQLVLPYGQLARDASIAGHSQSNSRSFEYTTGLNCEDLPLYEINTPSSTVCEAKCVVLSSCVSFFFDPSSGSCRLHSGPQCSALVAAPEAVVGGARSNAAARTPLATQTDEATDERCSGLCPVAWVGDGNCDLVCFVKACGFDGDDCAGISSADLMVAGAGISNPCDSGFEWSAMSQGCVPADGTSCTYSCPANSSPKDWVKACPEQFWDCECAEGFAMEDGKCTCVSEYSCPANSSPKDAVDNCPKYFWDCQCAEGFLRQAGECVESDYDCPPNSDLKPGLTTPRFFWDCECEAGYSRDQASDTCQCGYQCPADSSPKDGIECPNSFDECVCDSGYSRTYTGPIDGRCNLQLGPEDGGSDRLSEGKEVWEGPGTFRDMCAGKGTGYCGYAWWEAECPDQCKKVCSKKRRHLLQVDNDVTAPTGLRRLLSDNDDDDDDVPSYYEWPGRWGMRRALGTGHMDQVYIGESGSIEGKFCVAACKSKSYGVGCYESVYYKGQKYCKFIECEDWENRHSYIDGCHHEDKDFHDLNCKSCERLWPNCKDTGSFDDDDVSTQGNDR